MSSSQPVAQDRGTFLAEERTDWALERTVMGAERTLMAWIRTTISMIGFGFAIYKYFQYAADDIAAGRIQRPEAPRNLGLTLIALGTLALAAATWQHRDFVRGLGASHARKIRSLSIAVAIAVVVIGAVAFYGVLTHTGPF